MIDYNPALRRQAVFDLYLAFHAGGTHFTAELYRLIAKADPEHRRRLAVSFPVEVEVYSSWHSSTDEKAWFKSANIVDLAEDKVTRKRLKHWLKED